jgi:hypothetical protein
LTHPQGKIILDKATINKKKRMDGTMRLKNDRRSKMQKQKKQKKERLIRIYFLLIYSKVIKKIFTVNK